MKFEVWGENMKCVDVLVKGEGRAQEDRIAVIGYIQCNDRLRIDSCGFFVAYRSARYICQLVGDVCVTAIAILDECPWCTF